MPRHNPELNAQRDEQHARAVAKAICEAQDAGQTVVLPKGKTWTWTAEDLRGVPFEGKGVGGAINGTRPHADLDD